MTSARVRVRCPPALKLKCRVRRLLRIVIKRIKRMIRKNRVNSSRYSSSVTKLTVCSSKSNRVRAVLSVQLKV